MFQDSAMVQLRESLFLEKQKTIDAMREELEHERRDISTRSEERYENQISELETILKVGSRILASFCVLASLKVSESFCFWCIPRIYVL